MNQDLIKQRSATEYEATPVNPPARSRARCTVTGAEKHPETPAEKRPHTPAYKTSVFCNDATFYKDAVNEEMTKEIASFLSEWEAKMKKWETMGQWVEVRETLNGRVAWYNSLTTRLVFDTPPNVEVINITASMESALSSNMTDYRREKEAKYYLNRSLQPLPNEDVVERLLQFDVDEWNFNSNNANVYNYRLLASKRDHSAMLPPPQQYVFPEYFSLAPLPELLANKFLAKIKLPSELSKNKKYSLVQIKNDITTASDVIKSGLSKLDPPYNKEENPRDFIIKIVGQEAYMYGNKHVIEYEAVRDALRNEDDVEFALIKRTDFHSKIESAVAAQKEYCRAFESAYDDILSKCELTTTNNNEDNNDENRNNKNALRNIDLPTESISLYEFDWHYRLKIEGLSNVTALPRYDAALIKSVYVVAEIWCGGMILKSATLTTSNCRPRSNIRWGTWLAAQKLLFSQLSRESTLCLIVYGNLVSGAVSGGGHHSHHHGSSHSTHSYSRSIFGRRNASSADKLVKQQQQQSGHKTTALPLAWSRLPLIKDDNKLRAGKLLLNLWHLPSIKQEQLHEAKEQSATTAHPYQNRSFRYRGTLVDRNVKRFDIETQCQLLIVFDCHPFEVIAPQYSTQLEFTENRFSQSVSFRAISSIGSGLQHTQRRAANAVQPNQNENGSANNKKKKQQQNTTIDLDSIIKKSPLSQMEVWEKQLIWQCRDDLWHRPEALSAFVRATNWSNMSSIVEAHKYLEIWAAPKVQADAIEFLDYKYCDSLLRQRAVQWLSEMDDSDLQKYLLQLIQCLKFELHHDNPLSRFLIQRALQSPYQIGHYFFWHLKCEYEQFIEIRERFGLYLEEYLLFSCGHKNELFVEYALLRRLEWISKKVTAIPEKKRFADDSKKFFKRELFKLNRDLGTTKNSAIQIPLYPRWRALRIKVEECKYMSSKKVPLWLVFENADRLGSDIVVMYKYGDDLRQDMLTLQIISLMDSLWLNRNLDLHLKPYKCLSTGYNSGMLEIVLNSKTVNNIAEAHGGVFNERAIDNFIKKYNISPKFLHKAKETFARSVAGYCIATYVLGISDRHSSNYMVCKNGQFFHIDFGHFLGNWKTKWGIKRERTPLVFTNQMKYAITQNANDSNDAELYREFTSWCSRSYNILREQNRLLLILFRLMIAAGMEELVNINDIMYFQNALNLNLDNKSATKHIEKAIDKALKDWGTYVNNKFHQMRHQNKK